MINNIPPHWRDKTIEEQGNRWAGQVYELNVVVCFNRYMALYLALFVTKLCTCNLRAQFDEDIPLFAVLNNISCHNAVKKKCNV